MITRVLFGVLVAGLAPAVLAAGGGTMDPQKAPDLDGGTAWFNTDKPVKIADLKGKIVLLEFWTYC